MIPWRDLSSAEVRARLVQRGIAPTTAYRLVERRDHPAAAATITRLLAR